MNTGNKFRYILEAIEHEEASDPTTPPEKLEKLADHPDIQVKRAIAANPMTPSHIFYNLLGHDEKDEKHRAKNLSVVRSMKLMGNDPYDELDNTLVSNIAQNPSISTELLKHFSEMGYHDDVSKNPILPLFLLDDPDLAGDPKLISSVLLSKNAEPSMKELAFSKLSSKPKDDFNAIAQQLLTELPHGEHSLVDNLLKDSYTDGTTLSKIYHYGQKSDIPNIHEKIKEKLDASAHTGDGFNVMSYFIKHSEDLSPKFIDHIYKKIKNHETASDSEKATIFYNILDQNHVPSNVVADIAKSPMTYTNYDLIRNSLKHSALSPSDAINIGFEKESARNGNGLHMLLPLEDIISNRTNSEAASPDNHYLHKYNDSFHTTVLKDLLIHQSNESKLSDYHENLFNRSPIVSILAKHPHKEVQTTATSLLKKELDTALNRFTDTPIETQNHWGILMSELFNKENASDLNFITKTIQNHPKLKDYLRTHPVVMNKLQQLPDNAPELYGINRGDVYKLEEPLPHTNLPEKGFKIKTGQTHYSDTIGDFVDTEDELSQHDETGNTAHYATLHWPNPKTYHFMSQSNDPEVRLNISKNSYAPSSALHSLALDSNKEIRLNVANHPNTAHDTLNMMRADKDPKIRESAIKAYNMKKFIKK